MKKRVFTSDWHLVDGSKAEDTTNPGQLPAFLDAINRDKDAELFIAGDIVDLNQAFDLKRNSFWDLFRLDSCDLYTHVQNAHPKTIEILERMMAGGKARYIRGNHDHGMGKVWKRFEPKGRLLVLADDNNNLMAEHGHFYSVSNLITGNPIIEEPALRILGLLERYLCKDIDVWYEHFESGVQKAAGVNPRMAEIIRARELNEHGYKKSDRFYQNVEKSLSRKKQIRFLVLGHTHNTYFEQLDNKGECILSNKIEELPYVRAISSDRRKDGYSQYIINCGCNVNGHDDAVMLFRYKDKFFLVFDRREDILRTRYH